MEDRLFGHIDGYPEGTISAVSQNVIVAPASRSDPFPAFAIALTAGLISGVSATKRRLRMVAFGIRHLFLQRHEQQNGA
jgi:hypothetical protein